MDPTLDRRDDRSERVRVRLAVELGQGDFRDAFEADALNVSKGGISVRAACLPDLHSRLLCRFQCTPGGASVTALGEVVWAHLDGDQSGEFGLAFVDLDPKTEWLIEEMIAEHAASQHGDRALSGECGAKVATLELEGSDEPIAARVAHNEAGQVVFEQALDLLSLGRGVLAHAEGWQERAGNISGVELRMVGSVPMLAVTVRFDPKAANEELAHDTEPDLKSPEPQAAAARTRAGTRTAPQAAVASAAKGAFGVTVAEFGATERAVLELEQESAAPAWALSPLDHPPSAGEDDAEPEPDHADHADEAHPEALELARPVVASAAPGRARAAAAPTESLAEREFSRAFKHADPSEDPPASEFDAASDELDDALEAFSGPSYKPVLMAALRALKAGFVGLFAWLGSASASSSRTAVPKLRGAFLRSTGALRSLYGREVGLRVGAARRMVGAVLPARRRRTTTGPGVQKRKASGSLRRTLALGMLAAGAAGLAVYALAPNHRDDGLALHRKLEPLPEPSERATDANESNEPKAPTSPAPAAPPHELAPSETLPASHAPRAQSNPLPSQERVPASSPFAVDVRATQQAAKSEAGPGHKLRFGAAQVPKGRRFALRMSARVQSIEGVPDKGGFTLTVPGALSLDRAGPISSAVKSVKRAMVVNKGDHAELSIRFADGKQPAYQVTADGTTLYLVIEDTP